MVPQTSVLIFPDVGKRFISKYPTASEPTDNIATAASPFILAFSPTHSKSMAQAMVIGSVITTLSEILAMVAIIDAPNATCDSPSPINEKRLRTSVTPSRAEQSEISVAEIRAYCTKSIFR